MALVGVADRDGVDHDVVLAKPLYLRAPALGEVLTIGEDNDCPSLSVLLGVDGLERHIQSRAQVGSTGSNQSGSQSMQCVQHSPEILGQWAKRHPATGEAHHRRAIAWPSFQRLDQALGRLDRHGQAVRHRVLGGHAPAHVDQQNDVVAGR